MTAPTDSLRARLKRLAADPRARLLPEGQAIAAELVELLDLIDDLARRMRAVEGAFARAVPAPEDFTNG